MRCLRLRRLCDVPFIGKETLWAARVDLPPCDAGGRDRTGTGLLSPMDFKLNPDTETIESYLHESELYHNDRGEQDECRFSMDPLPTRWFCHN